MTDLGRIKVYTCRPSFKFFSSRLFYIPSFAGAELYRHWSFKKWTK